MWFRMLHSVSLFFIVYGRLLFFSTKTLSGDELMTGILDSVNQRTQLVGQNRLELLTFRLMGRQRYGINVFKVTGNIYLYPKQHYFLCFLK